MPGREINQSRKLLKILMLQADLTITQLARELGCSTRLIFAVIAGRTRSERVRNELIRRLGSAVEAILPPPKRRSPKATRQIVPSESKVSRSKKTSSDDLGGGKRSAA